MDHSAEADAVNTNKERPASGDLPREVNLVRVGDLKARLSRAVCHSTVVVFVLLGLSLLYTYKSSSSAGGSGVFTNGVRVVDPRSDPPDLQQGRT